MARKTKKKDAADTDNYVPQPAATEAEVLNMGFPNTGDADRDLETHMNRLANDGPDPKRDEEEEEEEEEDDGLEEVIVGGSKLRVGKDTATVLRNQELQLAELRGQTRQQTQPAPHQQEEEVDPLLDAEKTIFTDPVGTLRKYGESIEKRVTNRLTTQYQADRATAEYFRQFYIENKDLAPLDETVRGVLRANLAEVGALNPGPSRQRLAQLVRMQIDTIVNTMRPDDGGNGERREARRTTVESPTRGGTSRRDTTNKPVVQEVPKSMSSLLRERKAARAQARTATR